MKRRQIGAVIGDKQAFPDHDPQHDGLNIVKFRLMHGQHPARHNGRKSLRADLGQRKDLPRQFLYETIMTEASRSHRPSKH